MSVRELEEYWDGELKSQVIKCSPCYDDLCKLEEGADTPKEEVERIGKKPSDKGYIDLIGQYYIGKLVWAFEHSLADGRVDLNLASQLTNVESCLSSDSYWKDVFSGHEGTDEYRELKILSERRCKNMCEHQYY